MSKGSKRRPSRVKDETLKARWEETFPKPPAKPEG